MINIGMLIADRYEILERIGTGGMSDVYKAKDHKLNRFVAVKVLKQEFSENANFVSKFRVEAQAAAGLMHPNIVNVYDVGEEKGLNYIVMELVEGITLKKYIEKKARLSVKETISIAIQVAMGLEAAHNNHIIHRDIKPQNIIISREGKVKVTDFGIAKAATSNTITSNVMGSVHYTSPEQARGGYSDEKSDIYSLGVTIFEMLTGRVPFNGETTVAIAIKHIQQPMPSPCEFVPEIPRSVEQIVLKCCEKSPDRRYQSMTDLIADLKQSLLHPEDDFVKVIHPDEESLTQVVTGGHRPQSQQYEQDTYDEGYGSEYAEEDDYYSTEYQEEPYEEPPVQKQPYRSENYRREGYEQGYRQAKASYHNERMRLNENPRRRYDEGYDVDDEEYGGSRLGVLIAILAAIIVGLVVILFAAARLDLLPFGKSGGDEPQTQEEQTTETEQEPGSEDENQNTQETGIEIPDVLGKPKAEAVATLTSGGRTFVVNTQEAASEEEEGTVIAQSPEGGSRAENGSTVTITVSSGPDTTGKVKMPDLVYKDIEEAAAILAENNLRLGTETQVENSDANLAGKVTKQNIEPGTFVEEGTEVELEVAKSPLTYSYVADIASPAVEDPNYVAGTRVYVIVTTADGEELLNALIDTFPYPIQKTGLKSATGTLLMAYTNQIPEATAIDPVTGEATITPAQTIEKKVQRPLTFTPEGE